MSTCILYSSLTTDALQEMAQRRMDNLFLSHKLDFIKIDGSEAERKEIRDKLFSVSGQRGKYPQCFLEKDGEYKFIGLWNKIEQLAECDEIPTEILQSHPEIDTFSQVFHDVKRLR